MTPNDPLYSSQWHFDLIGDIETIWDEYDGSGVTVVVYDDGIDLDHADLDDNYDASMHFQYLGTTYDGDYIDPNEDWHGTSVGGLIGAENNGIGGVGVAFGSTLTSVKFLGAQFTSASADYAAMRWAGNFDIMSNSWGYDAQFDDYFDLKGFGYIATLISNMEDAVETGRGGLGTIIVKAAGNEDWNVSGSGINGAWHTIAVAATDRQGDVADYSNWGSALLIAAPAGSHTTDVTGSIGYSNSDYTTTFGGTSAATPIVSGVAALMLEANEGLGWRDVQNIMAISAAQTGSAFGASNGSGFEIGPWGENGATNWNGGGMSFHLSYGFGMIDAHAAVRMAEVWSILFGDVPRTSDNDTSFFRANFTNRTLNDNSSVLTTFTVGQDIDIEHIYVSIKMNHTFFDDVHINLIGPNGEVLPLIVEGIDNQFYLEDQSNPNVLDFTFGITAALGMSSLGDWTVEIADTASGDTGLVDQVEIEFLGHNQSIDDVHHLTMDFLELKGADAARGQFDDTNGGVDWLNMAAVTPDAVIDMENGTVTVDGVLWGQVVNNSIENAVSGDGDDRFYGDSGANAYYGMRGNDYADGGNGRDMIDGGVGNDNLRGGFDIDTLVGGDGEDELRGGEARDRMQGGRNSDTMYGGKGKDFMLGGKGNDFIDGQKGNDVMTGDAGEDTLNGGINNDKMTGGSGADTFIYNNGRDLITDFSDDEDILHIDDVLWTGTLSVSQVLDFATSAGGDTVFDFGGGNTLKLLGIADKSVLADDMVIV